MATELKRANFNGYNGSHFYIRLLYDISQNKTNNTSTVKYYLYVGSKDGYSGYGSSYLNGNINGTSVGSTRNIGVNADFLLGSKTEVYTHDSSGKKSVNYSASAAANWGGLGSASLSGTLPLPTIPRGFTTAPKITVSEITPTSIKVNWTTSQNCDLVKYKLNNGPWIQIWTGNAASGSFTISNLQSNTSYSIVCNCRRKDSQVSSDSNTVNTKTKERPVRLFINGQWKEAIFYVRVNGQWKEAKPYVRVNNVWKEGI